MLYETQVSWTARGTDIHQCDYATGLSRSMAGRVLPSERPEHVIYESEFLRLVDRDIHSLRLKRIIAVPNPLGVVGILSAFNFPVSLD